MIYNLGDMAKVGADLIIFWETPDCKPWNMLCS